MSNSTLFTLRQSWHQAPWLHERLAFASAGDSILLLADAVLALQSPLALASFVAKCTASDIQLFALQEDIDLRGIENKYPEINSIGYDEFVQLVVAHDKQLAW